MSRLRFNNTTVPSTPASGKTEVYVNSSSKKLEQINDAGLVRTFLEESSTLYRLIKITEIFNGTTSYTPTAGADALFVECIAGGGSGGGVPSPSTSNASVASGGGGGAYSALWTTSIKTFTVAVGAGGTAALSGAGGNAGVDTTFDSPSICTAKGGGAGTVGAAGGTSISTVAGGAGGAAGSGVGDIKMSGANGGPGIRLSGTVGVSGRGGHTPRGGTGGGEAVATGTGSAGNLYGGGSSGAISLNNGGAQVGTAGANGIIIVWEYQSIT